MHLQLPSGSKRLQLGLFRPCILEQRMLWRACTYASCEPSMIAYAISAKTHHFNLYGTLHYLLRQPLSFQENCLKFYSPFFVCIFNNILLLYNGTLSRLIIDLLLYQRSVKTLFVLGNCSCFCCRLLLFSKLPLSKQQQQTFRYTIRVSKCLLRLSANDENRR